MGPPPVFARSGAFNHAAELRHSSSSHKGFGCVGWGGFLFPGVAEVLAVQFSDALPALVMVPTGEAVPTPRTVLANAALAVQVLRSPAAANDDVVGPDAA